MLTANSINLDDVPSKCKTSPQDGDATPEYSDDEQTATNDTTFRTTSGESSSRASKDQLEILCVSHIAANCLRNHKKEPESAEMPWNASVAR